MSDDLQLIVEHDDGSEEHLSCSRMAIVWQGRELWIQQGDFDQLLIGVDDEQGDVEYANLLMRPMATNLVSLQLEFEPHEDEHVHGADCDHEH
ncbi:topoisomerase II [Azomonas macrocytogenes]|uniref:Topoisomerase II n=1 Tax=Azomonas macrocytogenes TaxID=69962 RepID=A0A839SXW5_AZOMA|nr:topoisomerase II [Azomonas macrocytogenes]MBB3101758.1 hypothetical protein [Azomonas macrocytogenes]